jgi:hypothetical protein
VCPSALLLTHRVLDPGQHDVLRMDADFKLIDDANDSDDNPDVVGTAIGHVPRLKCLATTGLSLTERVSL